MRTTMQGPGQVTRVLDADGKVICSTRVAMIDHQQCLACAGLRDLQRAPDGEIVAVRCSPRLQARAAG